MTYSSHYEPDRGASLRPVGRGGRPTAGPEAPPVTGAEGEASGRILDGRTAAKLVGGLLVGALLVYHRLTSYWFVVAVGGVAALWVLARV